MLSLLSIEIIEAFGLGDVIDEGTGEASTASNASNVSSIRVSRGSNGWTHRSSFASAWLEGWPFAETCFS